MEYNVQMERIIMNNEKNDILREKISRLNEEQKDMII